VFHNLPGGTEKNLRKDSLCRDRGLNRASTEFKADCLHQPALWE